jgi:hypothetical protein
MWREKYPLLGAAKVFAYGSSGAGRRFATPAIFDWADDCEPLMTAFTRFLLMAEQ